VKWIGLTALFFAGFSIQTVIIYRFVNPPVTVLMIHRSLHGVKKVERRWTAFDKIPQSMIDAVIASEDNKFVDHNGFDFTSLRAAYLHNQKGKRIRGASTITQQMCKNVFLWEKRSYPRKALEVWFTAWVELLWSKQRIMEVYLNVIEMGEGIYGIDAAAHTYYHKSPEKLSREEAAMIVVVLPLPRKRNPLHPSAYMLTRQHKILDLMRKNGKTQL
jgi:monofunctional biosynthetic peptidoglycan transglycosylase